MQVRLYYESDGVCFARKVSGCKVFGGCTDVCGTYAGGFYNPKGFADWVRLDSKNMVCLYAPEEVGDKKCRPSQKRKKP